MWWVEQCKSFPNLSQMAIDYLTIPAMSIDVERLFSHGCLLLSHVHSQLSSQSTCALLCLGLWSELDLIQNDNMHNVTTLPDLTEDDEMVDGWDKISST
ncbi:hypothetical protein PISMIDRAFT_110380 [Pisolithus microcarpus 441]|uniref:HAT C-terminal dimerisation domain-containing protein n=1 Tax=Pisolithus microcarpus 441 TaxID=765257 RepID=A0A0C9ZDE0_9AGAM|nr:hypothetical protein PISMIDRAFT_110380 [Pisolithus microcarpus 441]